MAKTRKSYYIIYAYSYDQHVYEGLDNARKQAIKLIKHDWEKTAKIFKANSIGTETYRRMGDIFNRFGDWYYESEPTAKQPSSVYKVNPKTGKLIGTVDWKP